MVSVSVQMSMSLDHVECSMILHGYETLLVKLKTFNKDYFIMYVVLYGVEKKEQVNNMLASNLNKMWVLFIQMPGFPLISIVLPHKQPCNGRTF